MSDKDALKEINKIIKRKWEELEFKENKDKLKEIVLQLHSIEDFDREYQFTVEKLEREGILKKEKEIDEIMRFFFEKWTFIFLSILNLDFQNPFILSYMFETLLDIEQEYLLEEEDEES